MKIKTTRLVILGIITALLIGITGCQGTREVNDRPVSITPQPGFGVILGVLEPVPNQWDEQDVYAFAASYLGDPDGEGIMALDENLHPKDILNKNGQFEIVNVPPGYYVIIFGPNSEDVAVYRQGTSAVKVKVEPDKIVDLGVITLAP